MPVEYYFFFVVLLILTAVADLIVGVANDAVNFLNSAIGSHVAKRNVIMTVASLGILLGATFSSGMMEVARKGIFNPAFFSFADVMVIFMAVMLTDILLLDLFNTFGLPTSTTVSIVFELLGAAVAVAFFKMLHNGEALSALSQYINASSTLTIISGIFLSVSIAFVVGMVVQWLSRLLFSFHYEQKMPWVGGIWSGAALSAIGYFLLFKGMKGASFMPAHLVAYISAHSIDLLLYSFIFWTLLMQLLISVFRLNVLRGVVLFGTFALAMAFAGNDLVNFIGVPLAGLESYRSWSTSGQAPDLFLMKILSQPVRTETWILLLAGLIMILTLWFSKKARTVTDTEVSLGRQDDGSERFPSNRLARGIVWYSRLATSWLKRILPTAWISRAEQRFVFKKEISKEHAPAFDLVRASVNLTAASSLIALATSLKLPLSTTFVSFMVAMGSSLADRAWGRGSAVYRIAGVLNVIGGWFLTAVIAFTVASVFASIIYLAGVWGLAFLIVGGAGLLLRTFFFHKKQEQHKEKQIAGLPTASEMEKVCDANSKKVATLLRHIAQAYDLSIEGMLAENTTILRSAAKEFQKVSFDRGVLQLRLYRSIRNLEGQSVEAASHQYLKVFEIEQDAAQSTELVVDSCTSYVQNSLPPFTAIQQQRLRGIASGLKTYFHALAHQLDGAEYEPSDLQKLKTSLTAQLDEALGMQVQGLRADEFGMRNSALWFSLLLETKDLTTAGRRFEKNLLRARTILVKNQA